MLEDEIKLQDYLTLEFKNNFRQIIRGEIHDFIKTFLHKNNSDGVFWAGGSIIDLINNTVPADFDLFFKDFATLENFYNIVVFKIASKVEWYIHSSTETHRAKTLIIKNLETKRIFKLQFIFKYGKTVHDVMDTFCLDICKVAFDIKNQKIIFNKEFIPSYNSKHIRFSQLFYQHTDDFSRVLSRIFRYLEKGYTFELLELKRITRYSDRIDNYNKWKHEYLALIRYVKNNSNGFLNLQTLEDKTLIKFLSSFRKGS